MTKRQKKLMFEEILDEYFESELTAKDLAEKYGFTHGTFLDKINEVSLRRYGKSACKARSEHRKNLKAQAHQRLHKVTLSEEVPSEELWKIRLVTDYLKGYTQRKISDTYRIEESRISEVVREVYEKYGLNDEYSPNIGSRQSLAWYYMKFFDDWGTPVQPPPTDEEEVEITSPTHLIVGECKLNRCSVPIDSETLEAYQRAGSVSFNGEDFTVFIREMDRQIILVKMLEQEEILGK